MMKIHLLTEYFEHPHPDRQRELVGALQHNLDHPDIERIHLATDGKRRLPAHLANHKKVTPIPSRKRMLFSDFFRTINRVHAPNTIYMLANLDIYYDHTLARLREIDWNNTFVCLTRWNLPGYCGTPSRQPLRRLSLQHNYRDSHDSWITAGPVKEQLWRSSGFSLGIPGCDGKLCYHIKRAGYRLLNPCREVISYHNHVSGGYEGHRTHDAGKDRLPKPYGRANITPLITAR